jgi:hypothetical protein
MSATEAVQLHVIGSLTVRSFNQNSRGLPSLPGVPVHVCQGNDPEDERGDILLFTMDFRTGRIIQDKMKLPNFAL